MPPGVACKGIIDPLPDRLRGLIRRHNHVSCQAAGIQLRAAAHIGPVEHDGHGFVGSDINLLFRMLEAPPLKRALAGSGAELALIVSDDVYRSLVCRCPSLISPEAFQRVKFRAPRGSRGSPDIIPEAVPAPLPEHRNGYDGIKRTSRHYAGARIGKEDEQADRAKHEADANHAPAECSTFVARLHEENPPAIASAPDSKPGQVW